MISRSCCQCSFIPELFSFSSASSPFRASSRSQRCLVGFFGERLALDFQLRDAPLDLVDFNRHAVDFDAQPRRGFIHQIDGFVRQKTVGDVAVRQNGRRDNSGVGDAHSMMHFVFFLQSAQDGDGVFHRRLADKDGLETALQRRVFFDVLFVFVERGGADAAQFPAGEGRLEHVGSIDRAFGRSRADQRVELVDKENDCSGRLLDFPQNRFQPVFEFAAILGSGQHPAKIQRDHLLLFESLRNVPGDDALRQSFDDGGFAHTRLSDQHGIVLGSARQDLDDPPDLVVPSDDRIQFAAPGEVREIARISLQCLIFLFRIRIGHPLAAPDRSKDFEDVVFASPPACAGVRRPNRPKRPGPAEDARSRRIHL